MGPTRTLTRRRYFRRGSAYVIILGSAMIITVIGLSALVGTRIQTRKADWINDIVKARTYAQTGMQWALLKISADPDWRTNYPNGQWVADMVIDDGKFCVWVTDPTDGNLTDSEYDPVQVKVGGYMGKARQMLQLELIPDVRPLEALSSCLHAVRNIEVRPGSASATLVGAPLSTSADLYNEGTINGAVEALSISRTGVITGTVNVPAPEKHTPDASIFQTYKSLATPIPFPGTIDKRLITPGANPYGPRNADGIYYIDTGGNDLHIKKSRIHGTLVVDCRGKKVFVEEEVLLHNARADYPVLIVDGDVEIKIRSGAQVLDEAECGNMNPPGSPFEGQSDVDQADVYPGEIRGLVHVKGSLYLKDANAIRGVVLCEGAMRFEHGTTITHDPTYAESPPTGYTYVERMMITPGSWQRVMP